MSSPTEEDRVEAMTQKIADLMASATGDAFLAKLFWDALDYERVNQPIPFSALPERDRSDVAEATIVARCEQLPVCYIKLRTPELSVKMQTPILKRLARTWPTVLTVFSNFGASEWDFVWQNDAQGGRIHRICVDRSLFGHMELARQLYALKAYDPKSDEELPEAEVVEKVDRVFRRTPRQLRWRRLLLHSPLLREIGRWELLSAAGEQGLRRQFREGQTHPSRDQLVYANLRLVLQIAKGYCGRGMEWEDLVQEGCIGLTRAADRFDPDRGFKFSTYATWAIRRRIQRAIVEKSSVVAVPVHLAEAVAAYRNYWRDSFVSRGHAPTPGEIMEELGLSTEQFRIVRQAVAAYVGVHHLPARAASGDGARARMTAATRALRATDGDPAVALDHKTLAEDVDWMLSQLDARSASVLCRRFGLHDGQEHTLEQIAGDLDITRERVRQIEAKAITYLQHPAKARRLKPYVAP